MTSERFLITGALGCIGSWAVKRLVDEGVPVTTYRCTVSRTGCASSWITPTSKK